MKAEKAVHKHEAHMHKGSKPTKFKVGGPTSMDRKTQGRNMSRVTNQRGK